MEAEMNNITDNLDKQDSASKCGKHNLNKDTAPEEADAKLLGDSINTLQALDGDSGGPDLIEQGYCQVNYDAAEDADDELDSDDDDYEEVQPLIIKKSKTDNDQVYLSTNRPEKHTRIIANTHGFVKTVINVAQAGTNSAEISHTAQLALKNNLPRVSTPYSELFSVNRGPNLLYPSLKLRRPKGLETLRDSSSDSAPDHSIMSSNTYLTSNQRGKMAETGRNKRALSVGENNDTAEIIQTSATSTESQVQGPKPNLKARAVLGYVEEDETNAKRSVTDITTPSKVTHAKKSLRKLFQRKGKEPKIPPSSSSGNSAGRRIISAPTLIDASSNAKDLLNSALPIAHNLPSAKSEVNYSRPIMRHSSSDVSSGSPVMRSIPRTPLHDSHHLASPDIISEGLTDHVKPPLIHDHADLSTVHAKEATDEQDAVTNTLPGMKSADASDSNSFKPSDYSGHENSIQQVPAPIVLSGRAKLVDVRPPHRARTAAPSNGSAAGNALSSNTTQLTDHDAEILGAQDAARYYYRGLNSQSHPVDVTAEDPFIDPPFRRLLAKPANDIAAQEMARIKAVREESEIHAMIKARLAAKDAANGGVRGAGIPRIDYGPPNVGTALGGNAPMGC